MCVMSDGRVHCKFCDWSTLRYFTKKKGGVSNTHQAFQRLKTHMFLEHMDELEEVDNKLDEEYGEKELDFPM